MAHICVIGIGGVGSWTVEALARTGVGHLTLIDLDEVCASNTNRQVPATQPNIGRAKIEVMAERIKLINPDLKVTQKLDFLTAKTRNGLLTPSYDVVVDAIDQPENKCHILDWCRRNEMPVVTVGGAGGKQDPTRIQSTDLTQANHDSLLKRVRKNLRREFDFPRGDKSWGIPCVFSSEAPVFPGSDGEVCEQPKTDTSLRLDCAAGFGAATFVTGTFGFVAASEAIKLFWAQKSP